MGYIISGSDDRTIRIWDDKTGAAIGNPLRVHTDCVRSIAYSPDGRHIISGSMDCTIRIWDAETGAAVGDFLTGHTEWVRSVAYSPDGLHIITGSEDSPFESGMPRLVLQSEIQSVEGHTEWVRSVAYSPDGLHIISRSLDGTIRIWDAETGTAVGGPLHGYNCIT